MSLIVSDPTIAAEGLGDFFKHLGMLQNMLVKNTQ